MYRLIINRTLIAQTPTDGQRIDPVDRQTDRLLNLAKGSIGDQHHEGNKQHTHID